MAENLKNTAKHLVFRAPGYVGEGYGIPDLPPAIGRDGLDEQGSGLRADQTCCLGAHADSGPVLRDV